MVSKVFRHFWFDRLSRNSILKVVIAWFFCVPKLEWNPQLHDVISMPTQQYTNTNYISLERSHLVVSIMLRYVDRITFNDNLSCREVKIDKNILGWLTVLCSQMRQVSINIPTISRVPKWSVFPSLENLKRTKGSAEQILRNRRHRAKNRISTLYRMTA